MTVDLQGAFLAASASGGRLPVPTGNTPYFLSQWIRPAAVGVDYALLNRFSAAGIGPLIRTLADGRIQLFAIDSIGAGVAANNPNVGVVLTANEWSHACGGYNGSNEMKAALDGDIGVATVFTGAMYSTAHPNWLFGIRGAGTNLFAGQVEDLAVWDTYLGDGEVQALSAGCDPRLIRPGNLVGYWPMLPRYPDSPYATEVLADSPWLYWRLDETSGTNADDSSPNNRDGTYTNGPTLNQSGALLTDPSSPSADFDATNDYVRSNAVFNSGPVTMEVWFNYSGTPPAGDRLIAGCMDGPGSGTFDKCIVLDSAGKVRFYIYDGGVKNTSLGAALSAGWHHIVGTVDGSTMRCYVDGVLYGSVAAGNSYTGYSVNNVFVAGANAGQTQVAGKRDEFALYTAALTEARVAEHYAAAQGTYSLWGEYSDLSGGGPGNYWSRASSPLTVSPLAPPVARMPMGAA